METLLCTYKMACPCGMIQIEASSLQTGYSDEMSTLLGLKSLLAHKVPKEFAAGEETALLASAICTTTQNGSHFCLQWPC